MSKTNSNSSPANPTQRRSSQPPSPISTSISSSTPSPIDGIRIDLPDSSARLVLSVQRSILAIQNEGHQIQQRAQAALVQLNQKEQAAQKAYGELIAQIQLEMDCVGLPLNGDELYFTKPKPAPSSAPASVPVPIDS